MLSEETSVNKVVTEYLERYAGRGTTERALAEFLDFDLRRERQRLLRLRDGR